MKREEKIEEIPEFEIGKENKKDMDKKDFVWSGVEPFNEVMKHIHKETYEEKKKNGRNELPKPCYILSGLCPYGYLVEYFPLSEVENEISCEVFGHDCPIYHFGELVLDKLLIKFEKKEDFIKFTDLQHQKYKKYQKSLYQK